MASSPVRHDDYICLLQTAHGAQILIGLDTWEACALDMARAPWRLEFAADGAGCIKDAAGVALPVGNILKSELLRDVGGALVVRGGDFGAEQFLAEALQKHTCRYHRFSVPIIGFNLARDFDAKVLVCAHPASGCVHLWEFRRLQRYLLPSGKFFQSSQWVHNRMKYLQTIFTSFGIPKNHFLKPMPTKKATESAMYGFVDDVTCSTFCLVALLVWFSANAQRSDVQLRARSLLACLIAYALGEETAEVEVALHPDAEQLPGLPPCGANPYTFEVIGGRLRLGDLADCIHLSRAVKAMFAEVAINGLVALSDCMHALAQRANLKRTQRDSMHLLRQLCFWLATMVDDSMVEDPFSVDPADDHYRPGKNERRDQNRLEVEAVGLGDELADGKADSSVRKTSAGQLLGATALVSKYLIATRAKMHSTVHLRMAVDAARVGQTDALCGVAMADSGGDLVCSWMPPQELPELKGRVESFETAPNAAEVADYRKRAREFLMDCQADEPAAKRRQVYRTPSYHWLCSLDLGMQAMTGFGLSRFVLPGVAADAPAQSASASSSAASNVAGAPGQAGRARPKAKKQAKRERLLGTPEEKSQVTVTDEQIQNAVFLAKGGRLPVLSLSLDQGPVGWPAMFFLLYTRGMVLVPMTEPPHRVWNDVLSAIASIPELAEAKQLSTLLFNLNSGPFDCAAWWRRIQEAIAEFQAFADISDPLFQAYLPAILDDRQEGEKYFDEEHHRYLLSIMPQVLSSKGGKVPQSRWFNFLDVARQHDKIWTLKMLGLMYAGVQGGYLKREPTGALKLKTKLHQDPNTEPAKQPTGSKAPTAVAEFRAACRNTLHVATLLYMDFAIKDMNRVMFIMCEPLRFWHGRHCKENRSADACCDFVVKQAAGEFLEPLNDTVRILRNDFLLERMGLAVMLKSEHRTLQSDSPEVMLQDQRADLIAKFLFALISHRVRGMLPHFDCYPLAFAALLSNDSAVVKGALATMKARSSAWSAAAKASNTAFWRSLRERSYMTWVYNRILFAMAAESDYTTVTPAMKGFIMAWARGIGTTKQTEDVFQKGRCDERSGQIHTQVTPLRRFVAAVRSQVLGKVHKYKEVDYRSVNINRSERKVVGNAKNIFKPRFSKRSLQRLSDICSTTSSAPYPSWTPKTFGGISADMHLMAHCQSTNTWARGGDAWQSILLPRGLLVKHKRDTVWRWSLGDLGQRCLLAWPAEALGDYGAECLCWGVAESKLSDLAFLVVLDIRDWQVLPIQWTSPLSSLATLRKLGANSQRIVGVSPKEPVSALASAAKACFFELTCTELARVGRELLAVDPVGLSMFDLCKACVRAALKLTEDSPELPGILANRSWHIVSQLSDLLSSEVVEEVFDPGEVKAVQEEVGEKKKKASRSAPVDFAKSLKSWQDAQRPEPKRKPASRGARGSGASSSCASSSTDGRPENLPEGDFQNRDVAQVFMPVGFRVYRDPTNHRWQSFFVAEKRHVVSKSFLLFGDRHSCLWVIHQTWHVAELLGSEPCPWSAALVAELTAAGMV